MTIKWVDQLPLSGKHVFIRVDFNVPLDAEQRITDDTRISYRQAEDITNRLATGFAGLGVGKGDRVTLFTGNIPEMVLACLAVNKRGAIWIAVSTDFRGELFEGSQYLLAWADELKEIKTICHTGRKANFVVRIDDEGYAVKEGAQVEIGGNER